MNSVYVTFKEAKPNPEHDAITEEMDEFHKSYDTRVALNRSAVSAEEKEIQRKYKLLKEARDKLEDEIFVDKRGLVVGTTMYNGESRFIISLENLKFMSVKVSDCTLIEAFKIRVGKT